LLDELFPSIYFDLKETLPRYIYDGPLLYVGAGLAYRVDDEMIGFLRSYDTFTKKHPILGVQVFVQQPGDFIDPRLKITRVSRDDAKVPFFYRAITMYVKSREKIFSSEQKLAYYSHNKLMFIALSHWLAYVCKAADVFIPRSLDLMTNPLWHPQNSDLRRRFRIVYYKTADDGLEPPTAPSTREYYDPVYDMSTWFTGFPAYDVTHLRPMKKVFIMSAEEQNAYDLAVAGVAQKETPAETSGLVDDFAPRSSKRNERSDGPSSPEERSEKALRVQSEIAKLATLIGDLMN